LIFLLLYNDNDNDKRLGLTAKADQPDHKKYSTLKIKIDNEAVQCTEWAKLNDTRYHRCKFPPGPWSAWSGPNIDGPAHPTTFWQREEISNRCFGHVS